MEYIPPSWATTANSVNSVTWAYAPTVDQRITDLEQRLTEALKRIYVLEQLLDEQKEAH